MINEHFNISKLSDQDKYMIMAAEIAGFHYLVMKDYEFISFNANANLLPSNLDYDIYKFNVRTRHWIKE